MTLIGKTGRASRQAWRCQGPATLPPHPKPCAASPSSAKSAKSAVSSLLGHAHGVLFGTAEAGRGNGNGLPCNAGALRPFGPLRFSSPLRIRPPPKNRRDAKSAALPHRLPKPNPDTAFPGPSRPKVLRRRKRIPAQNLRTLRGGHPWIPESSPAWAQAKSRGFPHHQPPK